MGRGADRDRHGSLELPRGRAEAGFLSAPPRVVVVGAGIGGLAAANRLLELAAEHALPLEIVVLEASHRAGGVLGTETYEGAVLERGPDSLVTHKPAGIALCRRLGLESRLTYPPAGRVDIQHEGRLVPLPDGFALLAPTRRGPLLRTPLLSWHGKLRALAEPLVSGKKGSDEEDESVASFVRRRYGSEVLERIAEPIVGAIYMADVERLSLAATFSRFLALEREHGSVTRGLRERPASGAPPPTPPVAALAGGLGQIVDSIVARLPSGSLRLNSPVTGLVRLREGYSVRLAGGTTIEARAVLLATPGHAASPLLRALDSTLARLVAGVAYASCVTVNLAWPARALARPLRTLGFFVPRGAGSPLVAAGFVSAKFPERVSADQFVARLFLGGALHPELAGRSDAEIGELATRSLAGPLGIREAPAWIRIFHHSQSMPQLAVGQVAFAERLRARLAETPGLAGLELAGGPLGAYGIPDSIAAGESAAARLFDWLSPPRRDSAGR